MGYSRWWIVVITRTTKETTVDFEFYVRKRLLPSPATNSATCSKLLTTQKCRLCFFQRNLVVVLPMSVYTSKLRFNTKGNLSPFSILAKKYISINAVYWSKRVENSTINLFGLWKIAYSTDCVCSYGRPVVKNFIEIHYLFS